MVRPSSRGWIRIVCVPPNVPNVYLVGVTLEQSTPLRELISRQEGILNAPQLSPSVAARIVRIDGQDVATRTIRGPARRYTNTRNVTWEFSQPSELVVREGKWWARGTTESVVSVAEFTATALDLHPGAQIEWEISGRMLQSKVVAVHEVTGMRGTAPSEFVFNPESLAGLPVVFYGGVRVKPSSAGALQRAIFNKYPTVTVVNVADVLQGKVWAAIDPTRRRSKRLKDIADIARIVESYPDLAASLPPEIRQKLS